MSVGGNGQPKSPEQQGTVTDFPEAKADPSDELEAILREGGDPSEETVPSGGEIDTSGTSDGLWNSKEIKGAEEKIPVASVQESSAPEASMDGSSLAGDQETDKEGTPEPLPSPEKVEIPDSPASITEYSKENDQFSDGSSGNTLKPDYIERPEESQKPAPETLKKKYLRLKNERDKLLNERNKLLEEAGRKKESLAAELHKMMAEQKEEIFMLSEEYESKKAAIEAKYNKEIQRINTELAEIEKMFEEIRKAA